MQRSGIQDKPRAIFFTLRPRQLKFACVRKNQLRSTMTFISLSLSGNTYRGAPTNGRSASSGVFLPAADVKDTHTKEF